MATRTYPRLVLTSGQTYTQPAGDTIIVLEYVAGDWDGVIMQSDTPGSPFYLEAPVNCDPVGATFIDTDASGGNTIDATDNGINGGRCSGIDFPTTRYWVNDDNDGDWDNASNWSTLSGELGGAGVPTSSNDVYFDDQYSNAGTPTLSAGSVAKTITFNATADQGFDQNGQTLDVSGTCAFAGSGTVTLDAALTLDADGDFTMASGPTYTISDSTCDLDLQGTGNLQNNSGGTLKFHKITGGANTKTTTHNGSSNLQSVQFEVGAGTWDNDKNYAVLCTGLNDITLNASHTITGSDTLAFVTNTTTNCPQVNAAGLGIFWIYNNGAGQWDLQGSITTTLGGFWNNNSGGITVNTNNYAITGSTGWRIGNNNVSGTCTINFGSSTVDLGYFECTTYNSGATTINAETATFNIAGDFDLGTKTTWVTDAETLNFSGTGNCGFSFNNGTSFNDIVINKTGGFWNLNNAVGTVNNFTVSGTNTAPVSFTSRLLITSYDVTLDGTGTLDLGAGITLNGASSTLHIGSTVGAVTATSCDLTMNTATAGVINIDKVVIFKTLTIGASATVTNSSSEVVTFKAAVTPLIIGNNGTLTCNEGTSFIVTADGVDFTSLGAGYTINGIGAINFRFNGAINVNLPALTKWGSGPVQLVENTGSDNGSITLTGDLNLSDGAQLLLWRIYATNTTTVNLNGHTVSCGTLTIGSNNATGTFVLNVGSSTVNCSSFESTSYDTGTTTLDLGTSQWSVAGNWSYGSNTTPTVGTSKITFTGTPTITTAGKQMQSCEFQGLATIDRLVVTSGGTYTWKDGVTHVVSSYTAGDWNGATFESFNPSSSYTIDNPAGITPSNMTVSDCTATNTVTANDGTSTSLGGNTNWLFLILTSLDPDTIKLSGGDTITVTGSGFVGTCSVDVDGDAGTSVTVLDYNHIAFVAPAKGVVATYDVSVTSDGGSDTLTLPGSLSYDEPPIINMVVPSSGKISGGESVAIGGSGFENAKTGSAKVEFGTAAIGYVEAASYSGWADALISITTPAHDKGVVNVRVTDPYGNVTTENNAFEFLAAGGGVFFFFDQGV